jgi:hypothetical protein
MSPLIINSSTLLELHVTINDLSVCFHLLDGRFDQLRVLYVITEDIFDYPLPLTNNNQVDYFYL